MKNQDLDTFFKSKSSSFNEMPSDDLWKKIQDNLSQKRKPKLNLKKTFFMASITIIVLISGTAIILNTNNSPEKIDKTTLINDSIKKENSLIVLDTTLTLKKTLKTNRDTLKSISKKDIQMSEAQNLEEKIYSFDEVAVKPEFHGGLNKLYTIITNKYRTPKDSPGGTITVTFVIEKDGTLTDIKTVKDIGYGIGEEAVRVLKECPKWFPGKHEGKIVRVQYTLPVSIKADESDNDASVHSLAGIEVKPEFIGGIQKFYEYIEQNYKTPKGCPGGKIYLTFIVEKDGSLSDVKSIRDVRLGSGEEAVRVLEQSPKWEPGEQNGKKVRVHYSVAITVKAAEK